MTNSSQIALLGVATLATGTGVTVATSSHITWSMIMFNSSEVTSQYKTLPCAGKLFQNIDWQKNSKGDLWPSNTSNMKLGANNINGCISVWWEKESKEDTNWKGKWNVLWGMKGSTYGSIFVSTLISGNKKIVDGSLYILQQSEGNKWKVIGRKVVVAQSIDSLEDDSVIKPGNTLDKPRNGWCFMTDSNSKADCKNNKTKEKLTWDYKTGKLDTATQTEQAADQWSEKLDQWIGDSGKFNVDLSTFYSETKGYYSPSNP